MSTWWASRPLTLDCSHPASIAFADASGDSKRTAASQWADFPSRVPVRWTDIVKQIHCADPISIVSVLTIFAGARAPGRDGI
jgi:hypothetical protein